MRRLVTLTTVVGLAVGLAACAKRTPFSPAELERVEAAAQQGVAALRVYTSNRVVLRSNKLAKAGSYQVDKTIQEASSKEVLKEVITPNTAGLVFETSESNGAPELYVTFDPSCKSKDCAFGFVQTEDGRFRLKSVPQREEHGPQRVYYGLAMSGRRMRVGKLASLKERNEVFIANSGDDIETVELVVLKKSADSTKTRRRRNRGID